MYKSLVAAGEAQALCEGVMKVPKKACEEAKEEDFVNRANISIEAG
jgi:hypothetical protein